MRKTISQTTGASSLVVVVGIPPADQYKQQCMDIQRASLTIIMKQEFEGDDTVVFADMDEDIMVGFLSVNNGKKEGRSRYIDNYINEMFHVALTILSNSLEVLETFNKDDRFPYDMRAFVSDPNAACMNVDSSETGIVETLVNAVELAKHRLPDDAYLAYKALRLLFGANSDICSIFRSYPK
jgi:hypothetical protein